MKKRDSKYELLRIIAMFLIVLHHSIIHGVFDTNLENIANNMVNTEILTILESGGKIGVFWFILITGFFMSNSNISIKKMIKLWLPIFFWSLSLCICITLITNNGLKLINIFKSMFPIIFNQYWFMTAYFFMYLLIPFLNVIIKSLKSKYQIITFVFLGLILIITSVGTTTEIKTFFGEDAGSMLLNFCIIYCWGGLIKRQQRYLSKSILSKKTFIFAIISILAIVIQVLFILFFKTKSIFIWKIIKQLVTGPWTLGIVIVATLSFIKVSELDIHYNPVVNRIASTTFGIYLISDNSYVRSFLWHTVFHTNIMLSKPYIVAYVIVISIIVFVICSILEFLRKKIFSKTENKIGDFFLKFQRSIFAKIEEKQ